METNDLKMDFNAHFGKKPFHGSARFLRIFAFTALLFTVLISYLANLQYDRTAIVSEIRERYINLVVNFPDIEPAEEELPLSELVEEITLPKTREERLKELADEDILGPGADSENVYADLPLLDISQLTFEAQVKQDAAEALSRLLYERHPSDRPVRYEERRLEDLLENPFAYKIDRNAALYMDVPDFILDEQEKEIRGYRDQDEVMKVFYNSKDLFEMCYLREARKHGVKSGYVKVEFKIAPDGRVLPHSVRILDSTIRNRVVEQCLKKRIRYLQDFAQLEDSRGNARIVHKFVFN